MLNIQCRNIKGKSFTDLKTSNVRNKILLKLFLYPRERSSGGYIGITLSVPLSDSVRLFVRLSVHLSVQIRVRPINFIWFDIGLPYLAHGCISMRRCVLYIHDPGTTLNFDLKGQIYRGLDMFSCRGYKFFLN